MPDGQIEEPQAPSSSLQDEHLRQEVTSKLYIILIEYNHTQLLLIGVHRISQLRKTFYQRRPWAPAIKYQREHIDAIGKMNNDLRCRV